MFFSLCLPTLTGLYQFFQCHVRLCRDCFIKRDVHGRFQTLLFQCPYTICTPNAKKGHRSNWPIQTYSNYGILHTYAQFINTTIHFACVFNFLNLSFLLLSVYLQCKCYVIRIKTNDKSEYVCTYVCVFKNTLERWHGEKDSLLQKCITT